MFVAPCWHCEDPFVKLLVEDVQQGILRNAILKTVLKASASFLQLCVFVFSSRTKNFQIRGLRRIGNFDVDGEALCHHRRHKKFGTDTSDNPFLKVEAGIRTPLGMGSGASGLKPARQWQRPAATSRCNLGKSRRWPSVKDCPGQRAYRDCHGFERKGETLPDFWWCWLTSAEKRTPYDTQQVTVREAAFAKDGTWLDPESSTIPELRRVLLLAKVDFSLEAIRELANLAPCSIPRRSCQCPGRQGDYSLGCLAWPFAHWLLDALRNPAPPASKRGNARR